MRKSLIALCAAVALTAPMIAQADANLLMAQPALFFQLEVGQAQPATLIAVDISAAADIIGPRRISMPQLEAADTLARPLNEGLSDHGEDHIYCAHAHVAMLAGAKPEVGWRTSTTAT